MALHHAEHNLNVRRDCRDGRAVTLSNKFCESNLLSMAMLLYTNQNNPATLKILIASNFADKDVELRMVNVTGELP